MWNRIKKWNWIIKFKLIIIKGEEIELLIIIKEYISNWISIIKLKKWIIKWFFRDINYKNGLKWWKWFDIRLVIKFKRIINKQGFWICHIPNMLNVNSYKKNFTMVSKFFFNILKKDFFILEDNNLNYHSTFLICQKKYWR